MSLTKSAALESVLFASGEPLAKKELQKILSFSIRELEEAVKLLKEELATRGLSIIETDTEVELRTASEAAPLIKKLRESELAKDLGKAGLESLAVIAYQGGATRSEIDWVRGVNSSTSVRSLLLRGLIEGREDETDRRRMRYTLTIEALAHLGLRDASELPRYAEFAPAAQSIIAAEQATGSDN